MDMSRLKDTRQKGLPTFVMLSSSVKNTVSSRKDFIFSLQHFGITQASMAWESTVTARTALKFQRARKDNSKCPQKKKSMESTYKYIGQKACKLPWNWVLLALPHLTISSLLSLDARAAYALLLHPPRKPANSIQWGRSGAYPCGPYWDTRKGGKKSEFP